MSLRSITVHLDERWYDALAKQAAKQDMTVEEKLDDYLDALIDQLPEKVCNKISQEIWQEQRQEAARRCSVLRVTQNGKTDHLMTEGAAALDALHAAVRLRSFLLSKVGNAGDSDGGDSDSSTDDKQPRREPSPTPPSQVKATVPTGLIVKSTTSLLCQIGRIFEDQHPRSAAGPRVEVDSKLKRKIREKKIAMGHKPDDHEEQTMG